MQTSCFVLRWLTKNSDFVKTENILKHVPFLCGHIFMMKNLVYLTAIFLQSSIMLVGQRIDLKWEAPINHGDITTLWFQGAAFQSQHSQIPSFCSEVWAGSDPATIRLINVVYEPMPKADVTSLYAPFTNTQPELIQHYSKNDQVINFCLVPVRWNAERNQLERIVSFEIKTERDIFPLMLNKTASLVDTSILATGTWYKLGVTQTGVYKITPQLLADCGFSISNLPTAQLRVYGNGKGMLPESNAANPAPGLHEIPLFVNDGGDGVFSGNDYALFYANGPHLWKYDASNQNFKHTYNIYSDQSFYFITVMPGDGLRVANAGYAPATANYSTSTFDDFEFIENDKYNLVGSGREWFGDLFDFKLSYDYTLQFANIASDTAYFSTRAVARPSIVGTRLNYTVNGASITSLLFDTSVSTAAGASYVVEKSARVPFVAAGPTLNINVTYNNSVNPSATAWLDYISIELRRNLAMATNSLVFRDKRSVNQGGVAEYILTNAPTGTMVLDVTSIHSPRLLAPQINGSNISFLAPADTLRTFVALHGSNFPLPAKIGSVANQNLHGFTDVEMVIVAYPSFAAQAERLANHHRNTQGLNVVVVTPQMIYNEFSSGMQDITAIKLLLRNIYKKPDASKPLRYLLLFGDASYDYKNRVANDHNLVPIYQSPESYSLYSSFCTDDYYGFLDDNEGRNMIPEKLDVGIGRMPVKSVAEAEQAVNKVIHYSTNSTSFGDWRNRMLLVADDQDEGWEENFLTYTDFIAKEMDTLYPNINIEKIYADSYVQIVKAGSQRFPEAQEDLFRKVERGTLVTSYLGHGGEVGWAKERILTLDEITKWDNYDNMPVFTTVTCEFTRVDDPTRVSAGEQLFLNPNGGAAALISTLRPVFATSSTYIINQQLIRNMVTDVNGEYLSLGEVVMATKNANNTNDGLRFALIGDPAMYLAIPKQRVVTDEINGKPAHIAIVDTLKALSKVVIKGHLEDQNGNLLSNFNGILLPTVFDKNAPKSTLNNDGAGKTLIYQTQENVIYRGKASVKNGEFQFEFVVPLDINFAIDAGKISYYATDSVTDAGGYNKSIHVGGLDTSVAMDNTPPVVQVFINDTNFVSGGLTNRSPKGLALLSDENGINTVGTGIGHELLGILDGNTAKPFLLNDYFQADLDDYRSGTVLYPFFDLEPGEHTLLVRAWDVANNMGQGEITFIVDESAQLALNRVFNYPNPFNTETRFQFEHNRAGEPLSVDIQIFDVNGQLTKRIQQELNSEGNRVSQITWDGTSDSGKPISSGMYVYRVIVKSTVDGSTAADYSKLVYIK
jgi:hypothetical protein